jgi:hypothetical protein
VAQRGRRPTAQYQQTFKKVRGGKKAAKPGTAGPAEERRKEEGEQGAATAFRDDYYRRYKRMKRGEQRRPWFSGMTSRERKKKEARLR